MKAVYRTLAVFAALLFAAGVGYFALAGAVGAQAAAAQPAAEQDAVTAKVAEASALLDHYFVGETDETLLGDGAVEGLIGATGDRWSYYISADDYASYRESMENAYVGIGVTIQRAEDESGYVIKTVTAGGPAEEAGVQVGDVLIAAAGQSLQDVDLDGTKALVRGEAGTTVELTFLRDGKELTLTVERRSIETPVVTYEMLPDGIGYITIENFDANCARDAKAAIDALMSDGAASLLFDVRYNPGGLKSELCELLDYLLPEGPLFYSYYYDGTSDVEYSDASCIDLPMAVLVNVDSYSAAEFFAAALQEYGAAKVVGVQTVGKGYFQNTFRLSDGSAMAISTGRYCTPNGVSLAGVGITPDEIVELSDEDSVKLYYGQLAHEDDAQLAAAVALLSGD